MARAQSRRAACTAHAQKRLVERAGCSWAASQARVDEVSRLLKSWHRSRRPWDAVPEVVPISAARSDGRRQFLVQLAEARLRVVYDSKRKAVVTVLPMEGA